MRFPTINIQVCTDTLHAKYIFAHGYQYMEILTNGPSILPIQNMAMTSLRRCKLIMHGAEGPIVKEYHRKHTTTENNSPWQNRAESEIKKMKK